jgi:hypothetical protein
MEGHRESKRRMEPDKGRFARRCAIFVGLANLISIGGLVVFFRQLGVTASPFPLPMVLWLSFPLATVAVTVVLPGFAVMAWQDDWWTRRERLGFSAMVFVSVTFLTFLNYRKLLGVR